MCNDYPIMSIIGHNYQSIFKKKGLYLGLTLGNSILYVQVNYHSDSKKNAWTVQFGKARLLV